MKVIFLDIDGVLNTERFRDINRSNWISRMAVRYLKRIVEKTGAVIVLSSGWRFWFDAAMEPQDAHARYLTDMLSENGLALLDKTPDFSTEQIRASRTFSHVKAEEIKAWVKEHQPVEAYAVLDDLDLGDEEVNAHLVRTDGAVGLCEEDAWHVIGILNGAVGKA